VGDIGLEREPIVMTELSLADGLDTLRFMAPEISRIYTNYTKKIDIW